MVGPFSPSTDSRGSPTSTGRVSSPWLTPTSAFYSKPSTGRVRHDLRRILIRDQADRGAVAWGG
jgi:hypothetical protein